VVCFFAWRAGRSPAPRDLFFAIALLSAAGLTLNLIYIYNEYGDIGAYCVLCFVCGAIIATNLVAALRGYTRS
jgi:hypothetical protein